MRIIETAQLKPGDYAKSHAAHHIYNGLDCCVTFEVLENLLAELDETTRATYNFSMSLHGPILDMNLRGLRVDEKKKHELMLEYGRELVQMQDNLDRISLEGFGEKINWNSPAQLKKFFYETIGLPPVKKRNSKGEFTPTVNREALEKFRGIDAVKVIVNHILLMRDQAKRLGMLRTGVDADGRFRSSFNIAGTNTGRLSSSYSDFDSGSNLQNIEERLRRIFVADAGYKFANIDLEQADSRNIGALCAKLFDDYTYLNACESGDLHTYVCRLAWPELPWTGDLKLDRKIADEKFYRDKSRRDVAKVLGHGTNYCGTPATMSKHSHIDITVVREFQKVYFRAFPAIERLHRYVERTLYEEGKLTGLLGRRRHFFGRLNDASTIREAVAYLGQNATSDELNSGLVRVWTNSYPGTSTSVPNWSGHVQFLAQVHDSILFQYPEDLEDQIIPAVLNDLVQHIDVNGRDFYVPAEAMVGWNWSKRPKDKPELNPDGLIGYKGGDTRTRQYA